MKKILIASGVAVLAVAMIAGAQGYAFNTNLTVGSTGQDVVALQTWLMSSGYNIASIASGAASTGYFGSQTKAAVQAYQTANGVPSTGFVGPLTRGKLNGTAAVATVATGCPAGYTCTLATGNTLPSTVGTSAGISTPGVEGILTVTQGPVSNTVVNVGQTMVPILSIRAQAQNSDIAIQRITLNLGTDTKIYNKVYKTLYVTNGGEVLATVPLNSSTVVQSGSNYLVTITGFSSVVSKNSYKDFVVKADLQTSIDTAVRSAGPYSVSVFDQGVRGVDGAGISQYAGSSAITQSITINASLTDNAIANISTNSASPQTASVPVTDTTNGQILQLPVLVFDVGSQNDSLHLRQVQVAISGSGTGTTTAAYLYQGATQISSAAVSAGVATFSNIVNGTAGASIPVNTTVTYTIKVDVTGVTSSSVTVTPSLVVANTTVLASDDSTVTTKNGSAPGFTTTVLGKGPAFSLASAPVATVTGTNQSGSTNSTSTVTATFNVNVQAIGSNVYFSSQASTTNKMFIFKVFNGAGSDVTSTLSNASSGFIIPSAGVITVGQPTSSFYVPQQNSAQIANVTYQFDGKDTSGNRLSAGPYSIEIQQINWSSTGAAVSTSTTSFDGLSAWRTNGINP